MAEEEKTEMTKEEQAKLWEDYVRNEVNTLLDIYLKDAVAGNVGIRYGHPEISLMEDGTKLFDENRINVAAITVVLRFEEPIAKPK